MKILVDTNILIYREDQKVLGRDLQRLLKLINKRKGFEIVVHPLSIKELHKDKNEKRRKIVLSKIETYTIIRDPPRFEEDEEFCEKLGKDLNKLKDNDYVDISLLYLLSKDHVDLLITEDQRLLGKAALFNLEDRLLSVKKALDILDFKPPKTPPLIKQTKANMLNFEDKIFDGLRKEYPDFDDWLKKIKREGRDVLFYEKDDGSYGALLIYKEEEEPIPLDNDQLPLKRRLKLSTLIVTETGYKVGEFFIRWSLHYALKNNFEEVYLTHYTKEDDYLVKLISEYGFEKVGSKKRYGNPQPEDVFLKSLITEGKPVSTAEIKKCYPKFYDGPDVKKFLVPIKGEYHDKLFIETYNRQTSLLETYSFLVEGNSIKKIYLSNSKIKKLAPGDILIFYKSRKKTISCVGVVVDVKRDFDNLENLRNYVWKRAVFYEEEDLKNFVQGQAISFIFIGCFNEFPLSKVGEPYPQSIKQISHKTYLRIKEEWENESFTFS
ncbi:MULTISPECIES: PIN domain-containing protein [Methanothermobacter]|uniref:N-acetyltransferase domain-containing protein n=1 Tax=Methanothermobacter wolfeii TaxID=145261 RepID=A0A9E7UMQ2_METWO|nr:hypothetical protein [Methanothermobacter wolfeii]NP_071813.1 hypothetical protein psiM100p12 [Methanothermobacter phage psiM100]AAG39952.1 unknown [Methanothermobacter phage psiM100]UXH31523.1 hypothetical protein N5910_08250 [Methanothermobacter wolfeii]